MISHYSLNMKFETTASTLSKMVTNTCFHHVQYWHKQNHMHIKSRVPCKRGCPRGHLGVIYSSKNALLRNPLGESTDLYAYKSVVSQNVPTGSGTGSLIFRVIFRDISET